MSYKRAIIERMSLFVIALVFGKSNQKQNSSNWGLHIPKVFVISLLSNLNRCSLILSSNLLKFYLANFNPAQDKIPVTWSIFNFKSSMQPAPLRRPSTYISLDIISDPIENSFLYFSAMKYFWWRETVHKQAHMWQYSTDII